MKFTLATGNADKASEFRKLFSSGAIEVSVSPLKCDVEESGKTFHENSLLKAKAYYEALGVPVLSDDSGLVIEKYPDILGLMSARFAPDLNLYSEKCEKILDLMKNDFGDQRAAYFVCVLCFYLSNEEVYFFEGRLRGSIGQELRGNEGFGYDPIFLPEGLNGLSLAEGIDWKNKNSHRAKACTHADNFFKEHPGQTIKK